MFLKEVVHLRCPPASRLAALHWEGPRGELSPNIYIQEDRGVLSFLATPTTLGTYMCQATENGFTQTLAFYEVRQKDDSDSGPRPSSASSTHSPETEREHTTATNNERAKEWKPVVDKKQKLSPSAATSTVVPSSTLARADGFVNMQQHESGASYLKELVAVSVLLVMCVCALLLVAAYNLRNSYRSRTAPHSPPGHRDTGTTDGGGTDQEREVLRGSSPQPAKPNGPKSPSTPSNGVSNGSNGHLPNIPI